MAGDGPGTELLSEGIAHFSTILLTEQVRGAEQRMSLCKQIEDRYANLRRRDSERPLVRIDGKLPGESRIIYDKGGRSFSMLHRLQGRERSPAAIREYVAAVRGERFPGKRGKAERWQEARSTIDLGPGEETTLSLRTAFEPERLVMDADVVVMMLERQKAETKLKVEGTSPLAMR